MDPQQEIQFLNQISDQITTSLENLLRKGIKPPKELIRSLANEISYIAQRLEELKGEGQLGPQAPPIETPSQAQGLEPGPFPSSNINAFKYDPKNQQLFVKFHGKDTADSGPTYSYQGIPEYIFDIFSRGAVGPKTTGKNKYHAWFKGVTPSLGAAMYALIKKGPYPYQRVA